MNDEQLDDFKQYLDARISQSEALIGGRLDNLEEKVDNLEAKVDKLEEKVDQIQQDMEAGFEGVGEAITSSNDAQNHCITVLEQQLAA